MATLREYFDTDFQRVLNVANKLSISNATTKIDVITRVHQDFDSNTKYLSFFIPKNHDSFQILIGLINNLDKALEIGEGVEVQSGLPVWHLSWEAREKGTIEKTNASVL